MPALLTEIAIELGVLMQKVGARKALKYIKSLNTSKEPTGDIYLYKLISLICGHFNITQNHLTKKERKGVSATKINDAIACYVYLCKNILKIEPVETYMKKINKTKEYGYYWLNKVKDYDETSIHPVDLQFFANINKIKEKLLNYIQKNTKE